MVDLEEETELDEEDEEEEEVEAEEEAEEAEGDVEEVEEEGPVVYVLEGVLSSSTVMSSSDVAAVQTDVLLEADRFALFLVTGSLLMSSCSETLKERTSPWITFACGRIAGEMVMNLSWM